MSSNKYMREIDKTVSGFKLTWICKLCGDSIELGAGKLRNLSIAFGMSHDKHKVTCKNPQK